jgi:hypothetical protein
VIADKERSVAGAFNRGIELAHNDGCNLFLLTCVDITFTNSTIEGLLSYKNDNPETLLWSGQDTTPESADRGALDGCAVACSMLTFEVLV